MLLIQLTTNCTWCLLQDVMVILTLHIPITITNKVLIKDSACCFVALFDVFLSKY